MSPLESANINTLLFGVAAMVFLFGSFLLSFVLSQRKKLQYHKNLHALHEEQQQLLKEQNLLLEAKVKERTKELLTQKDALQQSITELKSTQQLLIQSEKMASLGELTAGIAHEIQNPLNFVNNFAEINSDLLNELREDILAENIADGAKESIGNVIENLSQNMEKINHHGKRADGIVKSMLQHSRTSTGKKEPVNINTLADEYLRLSYHGLRAKDKTFNVRFFTFFQDGLPQVNIIQQDIGRVLLNLFNNAFYAVTEKKKLLAAKGETGFEPTVNVTTSTTGNTVKVIVADNGNGIPKKIIDKIFQPFFTTKPPGQGTGLGLSLSYDIVKAHGGNLEVETKEGESATFSIELPYNL